MTGETSTLDPGEELRASCLKHARELVHQLETGKIEVVNNVINKIREMHENELFKNVGRLTRELHDTLNSFKDDSRLKTLMQKEMPDVQERLNYVIEVTEQSTHRTLGILERSMHSVDGLGKQASVLRSKLHRLENKSIPLGDFDSISLETKVYLQQIMTDTGKIHADLSAVMMDQSYQDITGQIIQNVIKLMQNVESSLVDMLRINSRYHGEETGKPPNGVDTAYGPNVPGVTQGEVMKNQDDVDDLLSTLGF